MDPHDAYLNEIISNNRRRWPQVTRWLSYLTSEELQSERDRLCHDMDTQLQWSFGHTKPWVNRLSPGCKICGEGSWSCLFINNRCNASCFYCPAPQNIDAPPESQGLIFDDPLQYRDYITRFGFRGISFSGGEPLLSLDRVLDYLKELRRHGNADLYIWMYTNGILAHGDSLQKLADEGLDEIRFDIGATDYSLRGLEEAAGTVPTLTVEIPAVPEDLTRVKDILPRLVDLGVKHLNLHLLRLTPHNARELLKRDYTFMHTEEPTVVESELSALKIMRHVIDQKIDIGVNYCSFQYKNRYQSAGFRRTLAMAFADNDESVTPRGLLHRRREENDQIIMKYRMLKLFHETGGHRPHKEISLGGRPYFLFSHNLENLYFTKDDLLQIESTLHSAAIPRDVPRYRLWQRHFIEEGWRDYF